MRVAHLRRVRDCVAGLRPSTVPSAVSRARVAASFRWARTAERGRPRRVGGSRNPEGLEVELSSSRGVVSVCVRRFALPGPAEPQGPAAWRRPSAGAHRVFHSGRFYLHSRPESVVIDRKALVSEMIVWLEPPAGRALPARRLRISPLEPKASLLGSLPASSASSGIAVGASFRRTRVRKRPSGSSPLGGPGSSPASLSSQRSGANVRGSS